MLKLDRPTHLAGETFTTCISRVRDPALKRRLTSITQEIVGASEAFDDAAQRQALHEIVREATIGGLVSTGEMEAVYTDRMVKQKTPGRPIYDDLFAAAKGRCPLCAHRTVTTLDHHLPKAQYPALAVTPLNLVPSCGDCNKTKLASIPHTAAEVSIHPYFDDIDAERWLYGDVVQTTPAAVRFFVDAPGVWNRLLTQRVRNHFRGLNLSALYAAEAAEELLSIRHLLVDLHDAGGPGEVRLHLEDHAESCLLGRRNGWRGATYEAWADSDWFCDGGFEPAG